MTGLRLTFENPLAARELDVIDGAELYQDRQPTGTLPCSLRLGAQDFLANEPTRTAGACSTKRTHGTRTPVENRANEPNSARYAQHNRHGQIGSRPFWSVAMVARFTRTNPRGRRVLDRRNEPTTPALRSSIARTNPIPRGTLGTIVAARLVRGLVGQWLGALDLRERTHESGQRRTGETNPRHGDLDQESRERTQFCAECSAQSSRRDRRVASIGDRSRHAIDANEPTSVANASPTKRSHDTGSVVTDCANEPNFTAGTRHNRRHQRGPSVNASRRESFETNPRERSPTVRRNEATTGRFPSRIARTNPISAWTIGTIFTTRRVRRSVRPVTRFTKRTHESSQGLFDETKPPRREPVHELRERTHGGRTEG